MSSSPTRPIKVRATAGQADYDRPSDLFTLTEDPVWRNDHMEVRGDTLSMAVQQQALPRPGPRPAQAPSLRRRRPARRLHPPMALRFRRRHPPPAPRSSNQPRHLCGNVQARLLDGETAPRHLDRPFSPRLPASDRQDSATRSSSSWPARTSARKPPPTPPASPKPFPAACSPPTAPPRPASGRRIVAEDNVVARILRRRPAAPFPTD